MTQKDTLLIRVIDDDEGIRTALPFMLQCRGWRCAAYEDPLVFLDKDDLSVPGILLVDVRMPNMNGVELQRELVSRGVALPIVIITGHADVDTAVQTLKMGAKDFLKKPVQGEELEEVLERIAGQMEAGLQDLKADECYQLYLSLSEQERKVARYVARGLTSKEIGEAMGLSDRTVHGHRLNIAKKLKIHNRAQLLAALKAMEQARSEFTQKS
jgi:FixJ family two-component response regulator